MAKYSFKVYLEDGSSRIVIPSTMMETDLYDMDKFACKHGYFELCNIIAKELEINSSIIKNIKIIRNNKDIEFSLITNNEYLLPVLNDLHREKIKSDRPYQMEVVVISSNNSSCQEMRNYLLNNLRKDSDNFLNNIYNYNNEFSRLLNRYSTLYNNGIVNEENERELRHLEQLISTELRIYKNYRGLCRSRKIYEENRHRPVYKQKNVKVSDVLYTNPNYTLTKEFKSIKELTQDYNEEYEEFLDEEEFQSMTSVDSLPKGYK